MIQRRFTVTFGGHLGHHLRCLNTYLDGGSCRYLLVMRLATSLSNRWTRVQSRRGVQRLNRKLTNELLYNMGI